MMRSNELPAKVRAINKANKRAVELYDQMIDIIRPFLGKKIFKTDGSLLDKVKKLLPCLAWATDLQIYHHKSDYSLAFTVKTCETTPQEYYDSATYHETTVYFGNVKEGVLTTITEPPSSLRYDYTVEEVLDKRKKAREAKEAYDAARNACYPFDE